MTIAAIAMLALVHWTCVVSGRGLRGMLVAEVLCGPLAFMLAIRGSGRPGTLERQQHQQED
jgi:hypothetical protein